MRFETEEFSMVIYHDMPYPTLDSADMRRLHIYLPQGYDESDER